MSEQNRPTSTELIMIAAYAANDVFDERKATENPWGREDLTVEFLALQAIAGTRLAQPKGFEREQLVEERLDMNIPDLMRDLQARSGIILADDKLKSRVWRILQRDVDAELALRELMILGHVRIKEMRNLGDKGWDLLEGMRQAVIPDIEWPDQPDGGHATQFYSNLAQVPAKLIAPELKDMRGELSVEHLLGSDDTLIRVQLENDYTYLNMPDDEKELAIAAKIAEIQRKVIYFAAEFDMAKA